MQHIDQDFATVSLGDTAQLTVIQTSSHLNEVFPSESDKLKAGMSLSVEVIEPRCQELQGLALVSWVFGSPKEHVSTFKHWASSRGHRFGDIVRGKVRAVKPASIQVTLEDGRTGSVHVSEVVELAEVRPGSFPTSTVQVGREITARVIGGREVSTHR